MKYILLISVAALLLMSCNKKSPLEKSYEEFQEGKFVYSKVVNLEPMKWQELIFEKDSLLELRGKTFANVPYFLYIIEAIDSTKCLVIKSEMQPKKANEILHVTTSLIPRTLGYEPSHERVVTKKVIEKSFSEISIEEAFK